MTLFLGISALTLAILPAVAFDEPMRWPWEKPEEPPPAPATADGGVTFSTKRFAVTIGKRHDPSTLPTAPPISPTKPYKIAAIIAAILGLAVAPLAWVFERHRFLPGWGAALCCAALAWQYVLLGIAVGIAILLLLLVGSMM